MFNLQFNANVVPPNIGMDPVPSGIYTVAIVKSEDVPVSGKPGCYYYKFDMQIMEGDQKGKFLYERLNYKNDNQQTVDIAYGTLSAICHVAGVIQVGQSSAELHNRPFKVNVVKIPRKDDPTKDGNEIRGYLDMAGNPPKAGEPGAANPAQAAAFGGQQTAATTPQTNGAAAPTPAPVTAAPAAPSAFPPEGWTLHPSAPGYYYKGQEVLSEAQLHEKFPAPVVAAPVAPAVPAAPAPGAVAGAPVLPSWAT